MALVIAVSEDIRCRLKLQNVDDDDGEHLADLIEAPWKQQRRSRGSAVGTTAGRQEFPV